MVDICDKFESTIDGEIDLNETLGHVIDVLTYESQYSSLHLRFISFRVR